MRCKGRIPRAVGGSLVLLTILLAASLEKRAEAVSARRPAAQSGNLLQNPGFEGSYSPWNGINELQVAAQWTPWWHEDPGHDPAYFRPEYKRALASLFPNRVLGGESAQQWFTFFASHLAGMYQQVSNAVPGQQYRFTIWAQVWSSVEDDPYTSVGAANPHLRIGISPTGNTSPGSQDIIWSLEGWLPNHLDRWGAISVEAQAQNSVITVFMLTNPDFAVKHNDMYWDEASLIAVQPPAPTDTPTFTPAPPTDTPVVPPTPIPTSTPLPSNTPAATNTLAATSTPVPTETPIPTNTARPTDTPTPTYTPTPTHTPMPTATSTPTLEPPTETPSPAPTDTSEPADTPEGPAVAAVDPTVQVTAEASGEVVDQENPDRLFSPLLLGLLILVLVEIAIVVLLLRRRSAG